MGSTCSVNRILKIEHTKGFLMKVDSARMEPQTKKQGQKSSKEKRNGHKGLHSGKGTRTLTENQARSKKNKKKHFF
jgi:hypothetical protein